MGEFENQPVDPMILIARKGVEPIAYRVDNHGSILLVHPQNQRTYDVLKRGAPENAQWWGTALVVEPRYIEGVIDYLEQEEQHD